MTTGYKKITDPDDIPAGPHFAIMVYRTHKGHAAAAFDHYIIDSRDDVKTAILSLPLIYGRHSYTYAVLMVAGTVDTKALIGR